MILAMLLAHLVGDYILQWDNLSRWKSEKIGGVLVHGLIVTLVTLLFALPFDPSWWPWAIFIGVSHTTIDLLELPLKRRMVTDCSGQKALSLFLTDQLAHLMVIALALTWSGYLSTSAPFDDLAAAASANPLLTIAVAYAFLTMPAWIIIKFFVHGLVNDTAPDFSLAFGSKYFGIVERSIIATLILLGQFLLLPLVALPRLIFEWPQAASTTLSDPRTARRRNIIYLAELVVSIALAVAIGFGLRNL